jgi:hypothetical protein
MVPHTSQRNLKTRKLSYEEKKITERCEDSQAQAKTSKDNHRKEQEQSFTSIQDTASESERD